MAKGMAQEKPACAGELFSCQSHSRLGSVLENSLTHDLAKLSWKSIHVIEDHIVVEHQRRIMAIIYGYLDGREARLRYLSHSCSCIPDCRISGIAPCGRGAIRQDKEETLVLCESANPPGHFTDSVAVAIVYAGIGSSKCLEIPNSVLLINGNDSLSFNYIRGMSVDIQVDAGEAGESLIQKDCRLSCGLYPIACAHRARFVNENAHRHIVGFGHALLTVDRLATLEGVSQFIDVEVA